MNQEQLDALVESPTDDLPQPVSWRVSKTSGRPVSRTVDRFRQVAVAGFRVVLERSGTSVDVAPDESVLDAVARAGAEIDYSCEQGICGTCVTSVLGGEIDHRDDFLTDDEKRAGDQMCVCVSRCTGPELRLDI